MSAELIGDSPLANRIRRTAAKIGEVLAQMATAETVRERAKEYQSVPQGLGTRIGKSQTGGTLASVDNRAVDSQDGVFGENTIVTDTLDLEQATVGRKADLTQLREILQALC